MPPVDGAAHDGRGELSDHREGGRFEPAPERTEAERRNAIEPAAVTDQRHEAPRRSTAWVRSALHAAAADRILVPSAPYLALRPYWALRLLS